MVFWLSNNFRKSTAATTMFIATFSALLFMLHPVQTQTVSYVIQGQLEGLSALFMLLSIASFYNFALAKNRALKIFWLTTFYPMLLAATSTKEISIVTPLLILLVDWFWIAQGSWVKIKSRSSVYVSMLFITAAIFIYYLKPSFFIDIFSGTQAVQNSDGNILNTTSTNSISQYLFMISQFKVILHYLWIFIWPFNICMEYDWQLCESFFDYSSLIPFSVLLILTLLIIWLLKRNKKSPTAFGLLWFFICILPRSSFIASGELLVDYKTYLASFGLFFTVAWLGYLVLNKITNQEQRNKIATIITITIIALLSCSTMYRNRVWSTELNFWHDVICKAPNKARGLNNYGMALVHSGQHEKAIYFFKKAILLNSRNNLNNFYWDPYKNLSSTYALINQMDKSIKIIKEGLKIAPDMPELHANLGAVLVHQEKYDQAIEHLHYALKIKPDFGQAMYNLGKAYIATGKDELAWLMLKRACKETHMDRIDSFLSLFAEASIRTQNFEDAIIALEKLLAHHPNNQEALFNLGSAYYLTGQRDAAIKYYRRLLDIDPDHSAAKQKLNFILGKN